MWLLFTVISVLLIAFVNYIDEQLTANNPAKQTDSNKLDKHTEVGGLILISTLMSFVGALVVFIVSKGSVSAGNPGLWLSLASAIPFVTLFASYFYLLRIYPVYQVIPLFQLSSVWLLAIELFNGVPILPIQIVAILLVVAGSYLLDVGKVKWEIPGKLLATMIPVSFGWSVGLYLVRLASNTTSGSIISFWQFLGIGVIGILLITFVKKYRKGLQIRIKSQGKKFLGLSALNESLSQGSYFFGNLAIAIAPAAVFVSALSGLQGVFVIMIFMLMGKKVHINKVQALAIFIIAIGVFIIERF